MKSGQARPCAGNAASAENAINADNDRSSALPGNPDSPPLAPYRLACIAHKCLDISERCRLWQQDIPATPDHPTALFWKKVLNNLFNQLIRKGLYIGRGSV